MNLIWYYSKTLKKSFIKKAITKKNHLDPHNKNLIIKIQLQTGHTYKKKPNKSQPYVLSPSILRLCLIFFYDAALNRAAFEIAKRDTSRALRVHFKRHFVFGATKISSDCHILRLHDRKRFNTGDFRSYKRAGEPPINILMRHRAGRVSSHLQGSLINWAWEFLSLFM